MMLKLTVRDILRQKSFGSIAVISGVLLGLAYYFLTLSSATTHFQVDMVVSPAYIDGLNRIDTSSGYSGRNQHCIGCL